MKTILRIIAHYFLNQHQRIEWAFNLLLEAAMLRKGTTLKIEMTVYDETAPGAIEVRYVGPGEFKAWLGEPHNNLNHCNAAGCDGVTCEPTNEHKKGDF